VDNSEEGSLRLGKGGKKRNHQNRKVHEVSKTGTTQEEEKFKTNKKEAESRIMLLKPGGSSLGLQKRQKDDRRSKKNVSTDGGQPGT